MASGSTVATSAPATSNLTGFSPATALRVHIVYAHPGGACFTRAVLDSVIAGLSDAGHRHTLSDLYAIGFSPVLTPAEYVRESRFPIDTPVPDDVAAEQAKLATADAWVFVYPVWWTDCPAILKGWFDRVWTRGWAYEPQTLCPAKTALVVCTAGWGEDQLRESGCYQAMETTMLVDRIASRAHTKAFHLFGGSVQASGQAWAALRQQHLDEAYRLGRDLGRQPDVVVREPAPDEAEETWRMQARSLLASHPNDAHGVSRAWVQQFTDQWFTPDALARAPQMLAQFAADPARFYRVAEVAGRIVGMVHVIVDEDGRAELNSIYTDPVAFGTGVGERLMAAALEWIGGRPTWLHVAVYNARAIRFYCRHGFEVTIPDAGLAFGKIPISTMARPVISHLPDGGTSVSHHGHQRKDSL